ncbi:MULTISPECIES: hypothetical protein [Cyanophyceae]|uniref:Uncharacterized protein n=1 Tax=Nodularia spumigena CENA596 TaxID=1819295 RepID=A0A161XMI9_NODSP|nr:MULTISPECIES: hypothetical protein [Cyanophyceae]MDB9357451.1 hypothetical protein [Nodularia spumigena CS-587/03]KZL49974.1 hypothetical protein A2T98_09960 [Nodularia spumigena CENA596]MDB9306704.1 hypothetical protein [Nodularia spumigena CS-591/12]MDB9319698.1 hypothetical protein [Nodularia spumigena CS-590/01A]MDB9321361.1 hypothetical protein [Nodularia spumigena CS-591/07A]
MAGIIIYELGSTESQTFLMEITDMYSISVYGGNEYAIDYAFHQMLNFSYRLMDFMLSAFAIYSIVSLADSFITVSEFNLNPVQFTPL